MEHQLDDFGKRLKHLIDNVLNTTMGKFSMKTDIDKGTVSKIVNHNAKSGIDKLANIANAYPNVNIEWLLTGKGTPLKTVRITDEDVRQHPLFRELMAKMERIEKLLHRFLLDEALGKCSPVSKNSTSVPFFLTNQVRSSGAGVRLSV